MIHCFIFISSISMCISINVLMMMIMMMMMFAIQYIHYIVHFINFISPKLVETKKNNKTDKKNLTRKT